MSEMHTERIQPVSNQMPQWSNYKLASSGINPADSTLGLAIWQEAFWLKSRVVLKELTLGESDVKNDRHKARVQNGGEGGIVPGIRSERL